MPITVSCPECAQTYRLKDELAGKKVRCKGCEAIIPIPQPEAKIEEYNFDDDLDFDDEQSEREARRRRAVKKQATRKSKPKKKKRELSDLGSIDHAKATTFGGVGGGICLVSLFIMKVPLENLVAMLAGLLFGLIIGGLIATIILRAAVKLVLGMDLPFGDSYLLTVCNVFANYGAGIILGFFLGLAGFDPRVSIILTIAILLVLTAGVPSYVLGSCILSDDDYPVGIFYGFLIYLAELFVIIVLGVALWMLMMLFALVLGV